MHKGVEGRYRRKLRTKNAAECGSVADAKVELTRIVSHAWPPVEVTVGRGCLLTAENLKEKAEEDEERVISSL